MSPKQTIASLRSRARKAGITLGMAKLNDAIAKALYKRPYSSLVASVRSGNVIAPDLDPARAVDVAIEYGLPQEAFIHFLATCFSSEQGVDVQGVLTFPHWFRAFLHRQPRPFNVNRYERDDLPTALLVISREGEVSHCSPLCVERPCRPGHWQGDKFFVDVNRHTNGQALWSFLVGDAQPLIRAILSSFPTDPTSMAELSPARLAYRQLAKSIRELPRDNAMLVTDWIHRHSLRELWPSGKHLEDVIETIGAALPIWDGTASSSPCFHPCSSESIYLHLMSRVVLAKPHEIDRWHARYALMTEEWGVESYAESVGLSPGNNLEYEAMLDAQLPPVAKISLHFRGITEEQRLSASLAIDAHLERLGIPEIRLVIAVEVDAKGGAAFQPDLDLWDELERIAIAAALPHADIFPSDAALIWDYAPGRPRDMCHPPYPRLRTA
jgi:hypothetical protein